MAAYAPAASLGTQTTLKQSVYSAEFDSIITAAKAIDSTQVRAGRTFAANKLEFPTTVAVVADGTGHRFIDWRISGTGLPIIWEDERTPVYSLKSEIKIAQEGEHYENVPRGEYPDTDPHGDAMTQFEGNRFVDTLAVIPVPSWTSSEGIHPLWRLTALSVTVGLAYDQRSIRDNSNPETPEENDPKRFETDQDIADALTCRVHRIPYASIRRETLNKAVGAIDLTATRLVQLVSPRTDAGQIASISGLDARPRWRNRVAFGVGQGAGMLAPTGWGYREDSEETWTGDSRGQVSIAPVAFQATCVFSQADIAVTHFLAVGDTVLVSITGTDLLLNGGEPTFSHAEASTVLPVRSRLVVAVFESEFCK